MGERAGVWDKTPELRPEFREQYRRRLEKQAKARKAEELP
jgi:chlorophyllide a reductase subunit Y